MKENILKSKSLAFAIRVVNLYKFLTSEHNEYILSKPIMRSGTFAGAMIREAEFGQSKADFISKLSIAQKEINETIYWLELLFESKYINQELFDKLHSSAIEIIKLLNK